MENIIMREEKEGLREGERERLGTSSCIYSCFIHRENTTAV